jgi:hypothetical protein
LPYRHYGCDVISRTNVQQSAPTPVASLRQPAH